MQVFYGEHVSHVKNAHAERPEKHGGHPIIEQLGSPGEKSEVHR